MLPLNFHGCSNIYPIYLLLLFLLLKLDLALVVEAVHCDGRSVVVVVVVF